jgi:PAS domain S-box-containing protein
MGQLRPESVEQFIEAMPDGVVGVGPDGLITFANGRIERLSGYSREELVGTAVDQLVPERLRAQHAVHRAHYDAHPVARPMGSHLDIRLRRKDGTEFPADIALGFVETEGTRLVIASVRDITARRQAEAALREADEKLRSMVEGVRDYAIFALDLEGNITTWNPAAERIKGYTPDEILGRHFSVFFPPERAAAGEPERLLAEATSAGSVSEDGWRIRKDGSRYWASVVITAMRDAGGRLVGFSKIARDTTERKRQEDRVQAMLGVAQAILRQAAGRDLAEIVARHARALMDVADAAVLVGGDVSDGELVVRGGDGSRAARLAGLRVATSASAVPVTLDDVAEALPGVREPVRGPGLAVPLKTGDRRLGLLLLVREAGEAPFGPVEVALIEPFAAQAAVALDFVQVREELERMVVIEDRERIGRELHDGAIQALFAVGMSLQSLVQIAPSASLRERVNGAVTQIDEVIRDLRNYIFGLRPGLAADRHLSQALAELAERTEQESGVACAVAVDAAVASMLSSRAADVVQLTREALSNVARHAKAATCRLSLRREAEEAVLEVEDDGRGFVVEERTGAGQGLRNLAERTRALGGRAKVTSTPGDGTCVTCRIPLDG